MIIRDSKCLFFTEWLCIKKEMKKVTSLSLWLVTPAKKGFIYSHYYMQDDLVFLWCRTVQENNTNWNLKVEHNKSRYRGVIIIIINCLYNVASYSYTELVDFFMFYYWFLKLHRPIYKKKKLSSTADVHISPRDQCFPTIKQLNISTTKSKISHFNVNPWRCCMHTSLFFSERTQKCVDGSFSEKKATPNWHDAILRVSLISRTDLFIFPVKHSSNMFCNLPVWKICSASARGLWRSPCPTF